MSCHKTNRGVWSRDIHRSHSFSSHLIYSSSALGTCDDEQQPPSFLWEHRDSNASLMFKASAVLSVYFITLCWWSHRVKSWALSGTVACGGRALFWDCCFIDLCEKRVMATRNARLIASHPFIYSCQSNRCCVKLSGGMYVISYHSVIMNLIFICLFFSSCLPCCVNIVINLLQQPQVRASREFIIALSYWCNLFWVLCHWISWRHDYYVPFVPDGDEAHFIRCRITTIFASELCE